MRIFSILLLASFAFLTACTKEDAGPGTISTTAPMEAMYSTTDGIIPFPNNILFIGSTDGTLNITSGITDPTDITNPTVALNTLDGFSTVAPISTTFGLPIDDATITASSVRVFEVVTGPITQLFPVGGIVSELVFGTQFKALVSPSNPNVLVVKPIAPLKSNTNYMVVVTNALKSTSGEGARSSAFFTLLKSTSALVDASGVSQVPGRDDATALQLEGLRQLTQAMLGVAAAATPAIAGADVAIAWSFKTQTINKVLAKIRLDSLTDIYATDPYSFLTAATTPTPALPPAGTGGLGTVDFYSFSVIAASQGSTTLIDAYTTDPTKFSSIGSVVIGAVKLPYYLDDNTVAGAPLTTTFQVDNYGSPTLKSVQTVPFLMTIPKTAGPYPVVIFQHGFTSDKSAMFGIANTLSKGGYATIAIDSVLHGGRTFGLDYYDNTTGSFGPDGAADSSGKHYLNLVSLLTSRDNIRQSVADIIHLARLIENQAMDVVDNTNGSPIVGGDAIADLYSAGPISYVGHSNGGILGTILAGVEPRMLNFVFANPGGDYASIVQGSASISPEVNAGLAAKGVTVGSADYNSFFVAAQTIVDDGDSLNYASLAAAKKILLFKTFDDQVVPNAQTDNLSVALGLPQVTSNATSASAIATLWPFGAQNGAATPNAPPALPTGGYAGNGFTFFQQGTHASFLRPDPADATGLDLITEMQSEALYFLLSGGVGTATVYVGATPLPSTNAATSIVQ